MADSLLDRLPNRAIESFYLLSSVNRLASIIALRVSAAFTNLNCLNPGNNIWAAKNELVPASSATSPNGEGEAFSCVRESRVNNSDGSGVVEFALMAEAWLKRGGVGGGIGLEGMPGILRLEV